MAAMGLAKLKAELGGCEDTNAELDEIMAFMNYTENALSRDEARELVEVRINAARSHTCNTYAARTTPLPHTLAH
jgi:hypothetical protein